MGVVFQKNHLSQLSAEQSLRFDCKFVRVAGTCEQNNYSYRDVFDFIEPEKINLEELEEFQYAEIGNVSKNGEVVPVTLDFSVRNEESESLYKKIEKGDIIFPQAGDILISKIRPYLNKNVLIEKKGTYFTKAFIQIRPKLNPALFYLALRSIFSTQLNAVSRQGKGYPTLNKDDIKTIRFSKKVIDNLIAQEKIIFPSIQAHQREIDQLRKEKKRTVDIINRVFGEELDFDWAHFEKHKAIKIYRATLSDFAGNIDNRFGCRFHNPAGQFVHDFLITKTKKRVKDFLAEPIRLGESVSPSDYDEDGDYYYLAMSNIKTWAFEPEGCQKVSQAYSLANQTKTVALNDILLARSGEGTIGKVALIEDEDIQAIFSDFTQRIRLKNYNHRLAYYYFRSDFFQYLVYTHKKGLGNNTNIFPSQIKEFPMPDWDANKQADVVEKIKSKLAAQSVIDKAIEDKQKEIGSLIENAINA